MSERAKISENDILEQEKYCEALGLESAYRKILNSEIDVENDIFKVNLPNSIQKFESGNGEGIWAAYLTTEDKMIENSSEIGSTFKVVVLNDCIYYPFTYGSVIQVKTTGKETRPVLDKEWISAVIDKASNGEMSLELMLS